MNGCSEKNGLRFTNSSVSNRKRLSSNSSRSKLACSNSWRHAAPAAAPPADHWPARRLQAGELLRRHGVRRIRQDLPDTGKHVANLLDVRQQREPIRLVAVPDRDDHQTAAGRIQPQRQPPNGSRTSGQFQGLLAQVAGPARRPKLAAHAERQRLLDGAAHFHRQLVLAAGQVERGSDAQAEASGLGPKASEPIELALVRMIPLVLAAAARMLVAQDLCAGGNLFLRCRGA